MVIFERKLAFLVMTIYVLVSLTAAKNQVRQNIEKATKFGPLKLLFGMDRDERLKLEGEVRKLVWENWQARKSAIVSVTTTNRHGEVTEITYLIEPDETGSYGMRVHLDRQLVSRKDPSQEYTESTEFRVARLERVEIRRIGTAPYVPIPESEPRAPLNYLLLLKDPVGKVLQEL